MRYDGINVTTMRLKNSDFQFPAYPAIQARLCVFSYYVQGRELDLERGPPQKHQFASTKGSRDKPQPHFGRCKCRWDVARGKCQVSGGGAQWRVASVRCQVAVCSASVCVSE